MSRLMCERFSGASHPGVLGREVPAHFCLVQMSAFRNRTVFLWNYLSWKRVDMWCVFWEVAWKSISVFAVSRENFLRHQHKVCRAVASLGLCFSQAHAIPEAPSCFAFVSDGCSNKWPQMQGLKTTHIKKKSLLQFCRTEVWCKSHWAKIQVSTELHSFLKNAFHFQLQEAACISKVIAPPSIFQASLERVLLSFPSPWLSLLTSSFTFEPCVYTGPA